MSVKAVQTNRKRRKNRIIESLGGCCQICGYNRCDKALECHHIDPSQKEISISRNVFSNPSNLLDILYELKKCVCCAQIVIWRYMIKKGTRNVKKKKWTKKKN